MKSSQGRVLLACSTIAAVLAATAWATTATADIPSGSGDSTSSASPSPSTTASPSDTASPTASGSASSSASGSATSSASATSSGSASASASATGELDYIVTVREGAQAAVASAVEASGGEVAVTYDKAINGLAVSMTPAEAVLMRTRADVMAIERDLPVSIGTAYDDSGSGAVVTDSGCTANSMSRNDDYGTDSIDVSAVTTANWYGSAYSSIYINNNGGFAWDDGLGRFTSYQSVDLTNTLRPLVLPVFTDIDTTNSSTTVVQFGPLNTTFGGRQAYCVNWVNVGHYNASGPLYSAQALIVNRDDRRSGDVDIVFNYSNIASSTYALEVGFSVPTDRTKSVRFSGSGTTPTPFYNSGSSPLIGNQVNPPSGSPYTAKNGRYVYQIVNTASASPTPTPTPSSSCGTSVPAGTYGCATWGLDRIDQRTATLDQLFTPAGNGSGVTAYIVDTGVYTAHTEFTGRTATGWNTTSSPANTTTTDCHGHGTHVAGTVAGTTYGVAKSATIVPVKVLDCFGSGTTSGVIAGVEWIVTHHATGVPAVANMSLGGGKSSALDTAVANLVLDGVTVVVAAGNETQDACNVSPAGAPTAVTVGATTSGDALAYYSNYGTCVDILAPGSSITSAGITSTTATATMSGTSMASPHTAGAVAVYLALNTSATPAQVVAALTSASTTDVITGVLGSPNKLLYARSFAAYTGGGSSSGGSSSGGSSSGGSSGGGSSGGGSSGGGSSGGTPVTTPISAPVAPPVSAPVTAPVSAPVVAPIVISNPQRLTPGQVDAYTPGQVATIPGSVLAQMPASAIASMSAAQAEALSPSQVSFIRPNQAAAMNPAAVAALSPEQLAGFRPATVARLQPAAIANMSADQLAGLRTTAFARLTPAQTSAIAPDQVSELSAAQVAKLRPSSLAKLDPDALAAMSNAQLQALTPSQVNALTRAQLAALTPAQRRLLG